jgi:hypothetical protein
VYAFEGRLIPQPPGTKSRARLPRGLEDEVPSPHRLWFAVAVLAALVAGVVIGRWLLP